MIEVRDLSKSFASHPVLEGVSLRIEKGESVVIIGRSGGGKSVLLKHLIGLLKPDEGRVFVDSEDITNYKESQMLDVRQKIGMVFQDGALFDSLNVYENVGFRLFEKGIDVVSHNKSGVTVEVIKQEALPIDQRLREVALDRTVLE